MLDKNHGYVINIASVVSYLGYAKLADYSASKGGARGFSEALQSELYCMEKTGISVTCVCPYKIDTGMFAGVHLRHNWLFPALQPKYVADRVYFGARNREFRLLLPWTMHVLIAVTYLLPRHSRKIFFDFFAVNESMDHFVGHVKKE